MREREPHFTPEEEQQQEAFTEEMINFVLRLFKQGTEWEELAQQCQLTSKNLLQTTAPDSTWSKKDLEKIIKDKIRNSLSTMSVRRRQDFLSNFHRGKISEDDFDEFYEEALKGIKNTRVDVVKSFDPQTVYLNQHLASAFSAKNAIRRTKMGESESRSVRSIKFEKKKTDKPN